ncbi:MAG: hypothetical protein ACOH1T_02350 [Microbacteriaceae bacterium]
MDTSRGTEALVALEDAAPDVLFETVPGTDIQLWPLLRWPVARSMAAAELGTGSVRRAVTRRDLLERAVRRRMPNPFASARLRTTAPALFIVDGGTYSALPEGRKNWLVDDHARALDGSIVLQDRARDLFTPRRERPSFARTFSFEDAAADVRALSKSQPPSTAVATFARDALNEVYRHLDFDVDGAGMAEAHRHLMVRLARAPHTLHYFSRILDTLRPSHAFVQTGAYGDRSHLIKAMKTAGVHVSEHQHGWIGPSHGAYNHGAAMREPTLAACVPDTLLTFGQFWSDSVRFATETVAIGKPHIEQKTLAARSFGAPRREVIVISGMFERDEMTRFTLRVRDALPEGWTVLLRPHPAERETVDALYPGLVGESGVKFDRTPDVYESITAAAGVFGLASTVLYEALPFGCPVFVIDSPLADLTTDREIFGERVHDDASLGEAVSAIVDSQERGDRRTNDSALLEYIWKPDAVKNFADFVART